MLATAFVERLGAPHRVQTGSSKSLSAPHRHPPFTNCICKRSHVDQGDLRDSGPDAGPVPGDVDVPPISSLPGQCFCPGAVTVGW